MITIRSARKTDVGRVRKNNEDAVFADDERGLYIVCDGMGGHACGEVASRVAVDFVRRRIEENAARIDAVADESAPHAELVEVLTEAVEDASAEVYRQATTGQGLSGMGCTLTLLLTAGSRGAMAHVGDTRLYLCRDGAVEQLSVDHTIAESAVRRGEMTRSAAKDSAYANVLTRVIGQQERVVVETLMLDVLPDDTFLICSDGLSDYVDELAELASHLNRNDVDSIPAALIDLALGRGGSDNASAIVARATASDAEQGRELSRGVRRDITALHAISWLSDLAFSSLLRLLAITEAMTVAAGDELLAEGTLNDSLWVLSAGELKLRPRGGLEVTLVPGDYFGETSLLVARPSDATVRATEESRVLRLSGTNFEDLAKRRPWFGVHVLTRLARRLEQDLARE